jgi:aspartate/methionine/tyrosine aminotransferase
MGTPVDPVADVIRSALAQASDWPGYPATRGTPRLRLAAAAWLERDLGVRVSPDDVLPVVGTKEFISSLPIHLGLGPGDVVAHPAIAYPTYNAGARLSGATALPVPFPYASSLPNVSPPNMSSPNVSPPNVPSVPTARRTPHPMDPSARELTTRWHHRHAPGGELPGGELPGLVWVNSPSNPTGRVMSVAELRDVVAWGRAHGVVIASDECYITLGWEDSPVSILHPSVCDGSFEGLIAVYSLSKRSSLAGYRAGFVTGDPALVASLLEIRKHAGLIMPGPVQAALTAALDDDEHAVAQRARYAARRRELWSAFTEAGWTIDHSRAGLYLWATHPDHDCWSAAELLAGEGILVAPGELYGQAGARHIRVALTATDERIASAAARIRALPH